MSARRHRDVIIFTMGKRKIIIGLVIVVIVAGVAIFVTSEKSARDKLILANPPIEKLLFVKKTGEEFAPEQRQSIEEFKVKLLARAKLGVKLTERERQNFTIVLSDKASAFPNGEMVVNQSILQFSPEEIQVISQALLKK